MSIKKNILKNAEGSFFHYQLSCIMQYQAEKGNQCGGALASLQHCIAYSSLKKKKKKAWCLSGKNFKVALFPKTVRMINVKLSMMV